MHFQNNVIYSDLSIKNLQYLTSQQALADLAFFIESMNEEYEFGEDVKWIVFGGSYPGSLAAWLRAKYSHLVHGAMSASGPLLAQVDFKGILLFLVILYFRGTMPPRGIPYCSICTSQKIYQELFQW